MLVLNDSQQKRLTALLQALLTFVRAAQNTYLVEEAMIFEASIEAVIEQDLGEIAKGAGTKITPEAFLDKNIGQIT